MPRLGSAGRRRPASTQSVLGLGIHAKIANPLASRTKPAVAAGTESSARRRGYGCRPRNPGQPRPEDGQQRPDHRPVLVTPKPRHRRSCPSELLLMGSPWTIRVPQPKRNPEAFTEGVSRRMSRSNNTCVELTDDWLTIEPSAQRRSAPAPKTSPKTCSRRRRRKGPDRGPPLRRLPAWQHFSIPVEELSMGLYRRWHRAFDGSSIEGSSTSTRATCS